MTRFLLTCFSLACLACFHHRSHLQNEIESASRDYDRLLQKMDADSISLMYTIDGELGDVAKGRDSIRRFLATFGNVTVLSVQSRSENIEIINDTAIQTGTYQQLDVVDNKDTVRPSGKFVARWIRSGGQGWKIRRWSILTDK